jgi:hypothetical protein
MTSPPPPAAIVLSRIELECSRLQRAHEAMDRVAADIPMLGDVSRSNILNSIYSTKTQLEALASRTRKHGVTRNRLENLTKLSKAADRVVQESFALAVGALARRQGLDCGACEEADLLIAELAAIVDKRLARPTVPGDSEFLHRAADVIRRRIPDHGVWDLLVMAHEFGHLVIAHLHLYDPINDQVLEPGNIVLGGWADFSGTQGEELFCDVLATFALGPSYACTMLLHRLDPAAVAAADPRDTHPPDAVRAAVVLEVLRLLTKDEPPISRYRTMYSLLSQAWTGLQHSASTEAHETEPLLDAMKNQVRIAVQFLDEKLERVRYEWLGTEVKELADALEENRVPSTEFQYRIRDVLNAAWMLRLNSWISDDQLPAHVEQRARNIIAEIARKPIPRCPLPLSNST